jgi:hypothetical protein
VAPHPLADQVLGQLAVEPKEPDQRAEEGHLFAGRMPRRRRTASMGQTMPPLLNGSVLK